MRPFFEQSSDLRGSRLSPKFGVRSAGAFLFILPSVGIFGILVLAFFRNDTHSLIDWLSRHVIGLVGGLFLLTYGLVALLRPDLVLRWIQSAYPDRGLGERNPSAQNFIRALGVFVSVFGLFIFKSLQAIR